MTTRVEPAQYPTARQFLLFFPSAIRTLEKVFSQKLIGEKNENIIKHP